MYYVYTHIKKLDINDFGSENIYRLNIDVFLTQKKNENLTVK